jgi:hypothetical protein
MYNFPGGVTLAMSNMLLVRFRNWLILFCITCAGLAQTPRDLRPFLAANCYSCHNSRAKTAGLDLESYASRKSILEDRPTWESVLTMLKSGQMPPASMPRPDEAQLRAVIAKLEDAFAAIDAAAKPDPGHVPPHRLNRAEYNNTVRDLLGVDVHAADDFPQDDSMYGFDNIADSLSISPLLMEKYVAAAEKIAKIAVFGPDLKPEPVRFEVAVPRRMETTNIMRITKPAYYSMQNYDLTGLSQPGSYHLNYQLPVTAEYLFRITGAGVRPVGSEPTQCEFWIDGKLARTFDVANVSLSGFERRPDSWELRVKLPAGAHEFVVAFPRQFDGLPPRFGGPNPSTLAEPAPRDPDKVFAGPPTDNRPGKIEERRIAYERAKEQFAHPTWDGLSVTEFDILGPYDYVKGPSQESLRKIFTCADREAACMRKIVSDLAARAFRRPLAAGEIDSLAGIAQNAQRRSGSFERGVEVGIEAILVSPDFLFRIEKAGASEAHRPRSAALNNSETLPQPPRGACPLCASSLEAEPQRITDYELASRLSYFLWSSMPDSELTSRAADGSLRKPDVLRAEVKRMLSDSKSRALFDNFASEWLEVRRLESLNPDRDTFPDFDDYLRFSMQKETELFFGNLIRNDVSILDLIDGRYTFLNERLAAHYGIPGIKGTEFRKVDISGTNRGGVLGQGSVLTVSSYATRTSVVLRGKWVLENLLNAPPPPPPPNVPSLDVTRVGTSASLRQVMEQHRANPVCASCHTRMDPIGFGLENYDAVGSWRDRDGKFPVDSSGVLPDGRTFQGREGLQSILRADKDKFAAALTTKLLEYSLGRGVERYDQPAIRQITGRLPADGYRFSSLVLGIVNSYPFQMQRGTQSK